MGRVKEQLLDEDWMESVEHWIKCHQPVYQDLFDMEDITEFYMMELHTVNGNKYYIYQDELEEVNGLVIKWIEPTQLHKDNNIKQVKALMSVPISQIVCMTVYYEE